MIASTIVNVPLSVIVPDADVLELIECAGTGIAYWADRGVIDEVARTYRVRPDAEARRDDPDMRERVLQFGWIAKRLVQLGTVPATLGMEKSYAAQYARDYVGRLQLGEEDRTVAFDSDLADAVIQLAFFDGKVVFG